VLVQAVDICRDPASLRNCSFKHAWSPDWAGRARVSREGGCTPAMLVKGEARGWQRLEVTAGQEERRVSDL
jgi:hypothetical protein